MKRRISPEIKNDATLQLQFILHIKMEFLIRRQRELECTGQVVDCLLCVVWVWHCVLSRCRPQVKEPGFGG